MTRPLERALRSIPDVVEVRSSTERGSSTIDIYLKWGADLRRNFQYVQAKVSGVRGDLPANVNIQTIKMTTSAYPMSEYGIWSKTMSLKELHSYIRYSVLPQLIGVDGVYGVNVIGGEQAEIWIKLDLTKLTRYGIDPEKVANAVDRANHFVFIGRSLSGKKRFMAFGGGKLTDIKQIKNIVVDTRMGSPVYLKDIADLSNFHKTVRRVVSVNGHKGLFIDVRQQKEADGITLSHALDEKMAEIQKKFKGKLHIIKWDLSDFVQSSILGILFDVFLGIVLILLIVYSVLNRFRLAMPIILILPMVVIIEFLVLKVLGLTVNIMTLGGISAAIGIVADNSIVITENYAKFKEGGKSKNPIIDSALDIGPLMLWATLVTIIVFVPLNLLSGVSGLFFKPLSITLSTTIIISLFMAFFVTPIFVHYFIDNNKKIILHDKERLILAMLRKVYLKALDFALKRKIIVVSVLIVILASAAVIFSQLPTGFLPEWDEGDIVLDYLAPADYSIFATDKLLDKVEKVIQQYPEVKLYIRKTGTCLAAPYISPNQGEIIILLKKERDKNTFEMIDELRANIAKKFPTLDTDFHQILPDRLGDLTGSTKPIVVNVIGENIKDVRPVALLIQRKLKKIRGLNGVLIDMPPMQDEIHLDVNQNAAKILGLSIKGVARYARMAMYGEVVSASPKGIQVVPIREIFSGDYHKNVKLLPNLPIYTPEGGIIPLRKIATLQIKRGDTTVHHINGAVVVSVIAEISGRSLGGVVKDIKKTLTSIQNDKTGIELAGDYKNQQTSFKELMIVLAISMLLIFGLLLYIFESYSASFAVFGGTFLSATFVILGLFITGVEFDVSSFIGLITVMGIVVNNGILVIEFVERNRRSGMALTEALSAAGNLRFRPVLITNLAAIAGFMPMALNIGHGGEILYPFSIAVISGLIGSMIFSLIVMPTLYAIFDKNG